MDILDIELGDTIRLVSGIESLVISIYDGVSFHDLCIAAEIDRFSTFQLDKELVDNWINVVDGAGNHLYAVIPNISVFIGKKVSWIHEEGFNLIECIVKKANMQTSLNSPAAVVQERPCPQCGRKNDIGIKECWHCMYANP